jgi:hypothetical protein
MPLFTECKIAECKGNGRWGGLCLKHRTTHYGLHTGVTAEAEAVELCEELSIPFTWSESDGVSLGEPEGLRYHVTNDRGWVRVDESKTE